jgi:hypothetical protein
MVSVKVAPVVGLVNSIVYPTPILSIDAYNVSPFTAVEKDKV